MASQAVFTVTQVVGVTTTGTYSVTWVSGLHELIVGTPVVVAGCTTANFNGGLVVASVTNIGGFTTVFTATIPSTTHTDATESGATATYDPEGVSDYPTQVMANTQGYCIFERALVPFGVPYGNGQSGQNISGQGQIYPTGQQ